MSKMTFEGGATGATKLSMKDLKGDQYLLLGSARYDSQFPASCCATADQPTSEENPMSALLTLFRCLSVAMPPAQRAAPRQPPAEITCPAISAVP